MNNMIYTWLTVRHLFFSCCDPVNIKDIIESFTEETQEGNSEPVFTARDLPTDPIAMLGVNIPSFYGGFQT